MSMNDSIIATYSSPHVASATIKNLQKAGFDMKKLSVVVKDQHIIGDELKDANILGELSALGDEVYSCIPKEHLPDFEAELKANRVILVAHGTSDEIEKAKSLIDLNHPNSWDGSIESSVYYGCTD